MHLLKLLRLKIEQKYVISTIFFPFLPNGITITIQNQGHLLFIFCVTFDFLVDLHMYSTLCYSFVSYNLCPLILG